MTSKNDITGDSIANTKGNQKKYAENWEKIFGKKKEQKPQEQASESDLATKLAMLKGKFNK
jgi:hypothetical protein